MGALYDALCALESRRRGPGAYAVHKRLQLPGESEADVYDWVADQLHLGTSDRVLDVGCGVGFGTFRLAERGVAQVTGVTISRRELARARLASSRLTVSDRVSFLYRSFDGLPREAFDVVVAVESIKHSPDLAVSLRSILDAMAPGGCGVLVEDVFSGDPSQAHARGMVGDWVLARLYTEADYRDALHDTGLRVVDLTPAVRRRSRLELTARLAALNVALVFRGAGSRGTALRAFRGGLHLEMLYAVGAMEYKAFFFSKRCAEPG